MMIETPLSGPAEAERLRTAVYRFAELKRLPPPPVRLLPDGSTGAIAFASTELARDFNAYWRAFRSEPRSWGGFRDVGG